MKRNECIEYTRRVCKELLPGRKTTISLPIIGRYKNKDLKIIYYILDALDHKSLMRVEFYYNTRMLVPLIRSQQIFNNDECTFSYIDF